MILVYGTLCIDRIRHVPHLPAAGSYVAVQDERICLGGEAANTAYALANWGADMRLAGNPVGPEVDALLSGAGLRSIGPQGSTDSTPICDVYVTPDGQRTMFGIGFDRMAETIDPDRVPFAAGGWFTIDMNFGQVGHEVARRAKAAGMRLYLMDVPIDEAADLLTVGDLWQSSTDWHGRCGDAQHNLGWVEHHAARMGATVVLTNAGGELAVGLPHSAPLSLPVYPPPSAGFGSVGRVDSTGAGDRFRAGMLFGLSQEWKVGECLAFASAAAAMKLAYSGGIAYVPPVAEVLAFRQSHSDVDSAYAKIGIQ